MKLLEQVKSGRSPAPRRAMLYGTHGIGKSTFASMADTPVFIQTEDGLGELDCDYSFDSDLKADTLNIGIRSPTTVLPSGGLNP